MKYTFIENVPVERFDAFVRGHESSSLLQTSPWASVKDAWGHHLTGLEDASGSLVATGLVLVRRLPLGQSMWYLPRGPVTDIHNPDIVTAYLTALAAFAKRLGAAVIKADLPYIRRSLMLHDYPGTPDPKADDFVQAIEAIGYRHQGYSLAMESTIQPRFSAVTYADEHFLENLPNRTKRFLKDAETRFVTVKREGRDALGDFDFVISQTEENKGISLRSREYFETIWDAYGDDTYLYMARIDVAHALDQMKQKLDAVTQEIERLPVNQPKKKKQLFIQQESFQNLVDFYQERLTADGPKQVVAGALGVDFGYGFELLYAGRNSAFGRIPAQDAIYVRSMQEAFERGAAFTSTGGVPGTLDDGLTKFKSHFNPHFVEMVGEFDYPVRPLMYRALMAALRLRQKLLHRS